MTTRAIHIYGRISAFCFIVIMIPLSLCCDTYGNSLAIVQSSQSSAANEHAAEEFKKYANQITGQTIPVLDDDDPQINDYNSLIVIGGSTKNALTHSLIDNGVLSLSDMPSPIPDKNVNLSSIFEDSAFISRSTSHNGKDYLVFAGANEVGTLYAVYDYFERFCNVGYFLDTERVPARPDLPLAGIDVVDQSPNKIRESNGAIGPHFTQNNPRGFDVVCSRTVYSGWMEVKKILDWMAKNRLNLTFTELDPLNSGQYEIENIGVTLSDPFLWPYSYRRVVYRKMFEYARKLGIHYIIICSTTNMLDDIAVWQNMLGYFGTDHLYLVGVAESAATPEALNKFRGQINNVTAIDPDAIFIFSTWELMYNQWSASDVQTFLNEMPLDKTIVFDWLTDYETPPPHEKFSYYYGRDWLWGMHGQMENWDNCDGRIRLWANIAQDIANSPGYQNVVGTAFHSERLSWCQEPITGFFAAKFSWNNPLSVTYSGFIQDFISLRFGDDPSGNLFNSVSWFDDFNNNIRTQSRQERGATQSYAKIAIQVMQSGNLLTHIWAEIKRLQDLNLLRNSLGAALAESSNRPDSDRAYMYWVFEIARVYINELIGKEFAGAVNYYKDATWKFSQDFDASSEVADFINCRENVIKYNNMLDQLLATNSFYSLTEMKDRIIAIPGLFTESELEYWIISNFYAHSHYHRTDSWQGTHHVYSPELESILKLLYQRILAENPFLITSSEQSYEAGVILSTVGSNFEAAGLDVPPLCGITLIEAARQIYDNQLVEQDFSSDLDGNCILDINDLSIIMENWLYTPAP